MQIINIKLVPLEETQIKQVELPKRFLVELLKVNKLLGLPNFLNSIRVWQAHFEHLSLFALGENLQKDIEKVVVFEGLQLFEILFELWDSIVQHIGRLFFVVILLLLCSSYFDRAINSSHYLLGFWVLDEVGRLNTFVDISYGVVHSNSLSCTKLLLIEILLPEMLEKFAESVKASFGVLEWT